MIWLSGTGPVASKSDSLRYVNSPWNEKPWYLAPASNADGRVSPLARGAARQTELGGPHLVILEVAEAAARPELTGRRLDPRAGAVRHVTVVVGHRVPELAEAAVDGDGVERSPDPARDPRSGGEPAAQELLRHLPVAAGPERPGSLHRAVRQVGRDAAAEREVLRRQVAQVAEDQRLLGGGKRPAGDVVAELGIDEEAGHPDHAAVPVDVVPCFRGARPPEVIGEVLLRRRLVDPAEQAVDADVERSARGADDVEALPGRELALVQVFVLLHLLDLHRVDDRWRAGVVLCTRHAGREPHGRQQRQTDPAPCTLHDVLHLMSPRM